jgi:hypothetical protein
VAKQQPENPTAWVEAAWRIALGRKPTAEERTEALALLQNLTAQARSKLKEGASSDIVALDPAVATGLTQLCLAVFNLNEFVFVD